MKKRWKIFLALLTNAMLLGMLLLTYLDGRNPFMAFLTSGPSKIYIAIMCALGILTSTLFLAAARDE
ncbi:MAG: hypothetical protein IK095_07955 [Oscillospiraceae bacterium]|nr:hypothetical protein [Oscillospiraceae bacterium]